MDYKVLWRQKDKSWQCIISYKCNGKWKQKSKQGFKTQKEGKGWIESTLKALETLTKKNKQVQTINGKITLEEFAPYFLEHQELYKQQNTMFTYKVALNAFADLSKKPIEDIKKLDIQSRIDAMVKNGLSFNTLRSYNAKLKVMLEYYKQNYNESYTVPIGIVLPIKKSASIKKALTEKEVTKLLKELKDNKYYIVAYIAVNTGLRVGEILGLTWDNLDTKNNVLAVNKQWKKIKGREGFGELKTKNSSRNVPVSKKFCSELERYKKNSVVPLNNRIVNMELNTVEFMLNPVLRKLANITMHELRHTYATKLISNGIDFKTAAQILGHDVKQTMETYSHVNSDMLKSASKKINEIF